MSYRGPIICGCQLVHDPGPLYSVYEQFMARQLDLPVTIIHPPEARQSFNRELASGEVGMKKIVESLMVIDVAKAEASNPNDADRVKRKIDQTVGASEVNTAVKNSMQDWFKMEFKTFLQHLLANHEHLEDCQRPQL